MARPGLTIALLLRTPGLAESCQQWLPENRYEPINLLADADHDFVALLQQHQEVIDAVVIEQDLLDADSREQLSVRGLLFPAVLVGEV